MFSQLFDKVSASFENFSTLGWAKATVSKACNQVGNQLGRWVA